MMMIIIIIMSEVSWSLLFPKDFQFWQCRLFLRLWEAFHSTHTHKPKWKEQKGIIIIIAVPSDVRVGEKEMEKVEKHQDLKKEIGRLWTLKMVKIVSVVMGTLGNVAKEFDSWIGKLGKTYYVGVIEKIALLGTARILIWEVKKSLWWIINYSPNRRNDNSQNMMLKSKWKNNNRKNNRKNFSSIFRFANLLTVNYLMIRYTNITYNETFSSKNDVHSNEVKHSTVGI